MDLQTVPRFIIIILYGTCSVFVFVLSQNYGIYLVVINVKNAMSESRLNSVEGSNKASEIHIHCDLDKTFHLASVLDLFNLEKKIIYFAS